MRNRAAMKDCECQLYDGVADGEYDTKATRSSCLSVREEGQELQKERELRASNGKVMEEQAAEEHLSRLLASRTRMDMKKESSHQPRDMVQLEETFLVEAQLTD